MIKNDKILNFVVLKKNILQTKIASVNLKAPENDKF